MGSIYISVVVPTFNRKEVLKKCIQALFDQDLDKSDYEIIVIDDGSSDGSREMLKSIIDKAPCKMAYFCHSRKGPAAARNAGIRHAIGRIILFIDDDIITVPGLLREHGDWHRRYARDNIAVLGYVTWSPEIKVTPFMRWLEEGTQFDYRQFYDKIDIDNPRYFYSANLSLSRKFLLENNVFFSEDFPYAACEDTELSYRLKEFGMDLKFNKEAIGYHYNPTSLLTYSKRMSYVGTSIAILSQKLPEYFSVNKSDTTPLKRWVKSLYPIITAAVSFLDYYLGIELKPLYGKIMDYYRDVGIEKELSKRRLNGVS
ncbi:MAG: glycosyltransferase family 2 protein [Candidatus Omnitrophica bacterium]|nr:glycosyltransferase family 2 protein [Candidatus Omnitrophota bacterium]